MNFAILDDNELVLNSLMQSKLKCMNYLLNMNNQVVDHTKFQFLDTTKTLANHSTARYLAIHQYIGPGRGMHIGGHYWGTLKNNSIIHIW